MSSIKAWPIIVILFMVVIIFTGVNEIGQQSLTNSNLDNKSKVLIVNINSQLNENFDDLSLPSSNLTNGTSFEGQDPFVQQFLESKEDTSRLEGLSSQIISIPDLLILGINDDISEEDYQIYNVLLNALILIILFVIGFVAIFGDGRIT